MKLVTSKSASEDLHMVVLECPYDHFDNREVRELLCKVVALKISSYGMVYPYGILPVDGADFVGDHLLLCKLNNGELNPVATYRSLTLSRVRTHRLKFPLQNMLEGCEGSEEHLKALRRIFARHENAPDTLAYQSGWTIDPAYRGDKEVSAEIKSLMTALVCSYTREYRITEAVGAGSCRFKADQYFCKWGFAGFTDETGKELPLLKVPSFYDEESRIIGCTSFSDYSLGESTRWEDKWRNRITLTQNRTDTGKKAA